QAQERTADGTVETANPGALQPENGCQKAIQRRGWHRNLGHRLLLGGQAAPPLGHAQNNERKKQCEIGVGQSNDREPSGPNELFESRAIVPAQLPGEDRVVSTEHLHRSNIDQGVSARAGQPEHFADRGSYIGFAQGIQNIKRSDEIKYAASERRCGDAGPRQAGSTGLPANAEADGGKIEPKRIAETAEHFQVGASATTAVENPWIPAVADGVLDQGSHECPEAAEPEVPLLGDGRGAQQVLHAPILTFGKNSALFH